MNEEPEKTRTPPPSIAKCILLLICYFFAYAGSVNNGIFGVVPAIPFIIVILFSLKNNWKSKYNFLSYIVLILCITLYFLKIQKGTAFHPPIEKTMITTRDTCLVQYEGDTNNNFVVLTTQTNIDKGCDSSHVRSAIKWEVLRSGTKLTLKKVFISNADFGETYAIAFDTSLGEASEYFYGSSKESYLSWEDGSPVQAKDLRRDIFYKPTVVLFLFLPIATRLARLIF